jgi:S-formylglutathione hydrolase
MLEDAVQRGAMSAMHIVTPEVGPFSFYLDDAQRGMGWESFIVERLVPRVASDVALGIVGISMGGYGALKLAFQTPDRIRAVAAISPMIEPSLEANRVSARNCFHYPPQVPAALLGARRDADLYRQDHPANRAIASADKIRAHDQAIYIDAASEDALNAHDGAEFLHRVLWDLDIAHEYRLLRDADHVGPTIVARLESAFAWVATHLTASPPSLSDQERAWLRWLDEGSVGVPPPELPPTSAVFPRVLRSMLASAKASAFSRDPTTARRYGLAARWGLCGS